MKRFTILFSFFLFLSFQSFSQVDYFTSFDGCSAASCSGWTISGGYLPSITAAPGSGYTPCNTASAKSNIYAGVATTTLAATTSLGLSGGGATVLSMIGKAINYTTGAATPAGSATFTASWATAASGPWTVISSLPNVSSTTCQTYTFNSFNPTAGQPLFIRIVAVRSAGDFWVVMDDISVQEEALAVCLNAPNGLWPPATFTNPLCDGTLQTVTTSAWTGEYSNVNVVAGNTYTFTSSVATDYITIADAAGSMAYIAGTTPVEWVAAVTATVRFYRHDDDQCNYSNTNRTVSVSCQEPPPPVCFNAPNGLWPTATFTNTLCDGTLQTVTTGAWTGEYSNVNVTEGNTYTFVSSVATDFLTIANTAGDAAYVAAVTPVQWEASFTGMVRFYRHNDDQCGVSNVSRTVSVSCQIICLDTPNGQWPLSTFTNSVCDDTPQLVTSGAYTGEYSLVNVSEGNIYTFSSSVETDFITIANMAGTITISAGITPLAWEADFTGTVRFIRHDDEICSYSDEDRSIFVACVPSFIPPGSNCTEPILVDALPYEALGQTNCGYGNNYSETCLGFYDGGEDIFYSFTIIEEATTVDIVLDPKTTNYVGMGLFDQCPPPASGCILTGNNGFSGGLIQFLQVTLEPGTYYLMIDTWPTPNCVPNFDLFISETPVGMLAGTVTSALSGLPLQGVNVELSPGGLQTYTDASGDYEFDLFAGVYLATFSYPGYVQVAFEVNVPSDDVEILDVEMEMEPMPACVNLVGPADNSTNQLPMIELQWEASLLGGLPMGYRISVYDITANEWLEEDTDLGNVTFYAPAGGFEWGHEYAWIVTPYNLSGEPSYCDPWFFSISFAGKIVGTVTDEFSGNAIEGVTVQLVNIFPNAGFTTSVATDEFGNWEFEWQAGIYNISFSKFGYFGKSVNNVTMGNNQVVTLSTQLEPVSPYQIPFFEDWSSGSFNTQEWSREGNWQLSTSGFPGPSAYFHWDPRRYNFDDDLISYNIDGTGYDELYAQFVFYLIDYTASSGIFTLTFMVFDGEEWHDVASFNNQFGDIIGYYTADISQYAAGRQFLLGFKVTGVDTWDTDGIYLDNILVTNYLFDVAPNKIADALIMDATSHHTVDLMNFGNSSLPWQAEVFPPSDWVILDNVSGTAAPGMGSLGFTFDASTVPAGTYTAELVISILGGMIQKTVQLEMKKTDQFGQKIMIPTANNWGYISTFISSPNKASIEDQFEDIKDDMIILLGKNGFYWPQFQINTIGEFNPLEGYKLKMGETTSLIFEGDVIENQKLNVSAGTHIIPVLSQTPVSTATLFAGKPVDFAFSLDGLLYWPAGGVYSLVSLEPGYGYLARFSASTILDFAAKSDAPANKPVSIENNTTWNEVTKTGDVHIVGVSANATDELLEGDYIGIFNLNDLCVGMAQYAGNSQPFAITVFANDMTTASVDGMNEGEPLIIRVYRDGIVLEMQAVYNNSMPNADGLFAVNGLSLIDSFKEGATSVIENPAAAVRVYPNPSTGVFNITGVNDAYEMVVTNSQGQVVISTRIDDAQVLDLSTMPNGVYFIRLVNDHGVKLVKVIKN